MTPGPGESRRLFVGDRLRFTLQDARGRRPTKGWRALLRTNLGRAEALRLEMIRAHAQALPPAGEPGATMLVHPETGETLIAHLSKLNTRPPVKRGTELWGG